ncbi:MAG: hypothetical protein WCB90_14275 [Methanosarcina sp.]
MYISDIMIYDCFLFFNELELLELRLTELNDVVDKFVLVESTKTLTAEPKKLYYMENKNLFKDYSDKIIHVVVNDLPDAVPMPKYREIFLRNTISRGLTGCTDNDTIILSDIDELPDKKIIKNFEIKDYPICLHTPLYYYYINCLAENHDWEGSVIIQYGTFKTKAPQWFRDYRYTFAKLNSAGWHFSYLYGAERIIQKMRTMGDITDMAVIDRFSNKDWVKKCISEYVDLYDRPIKLKIVPLDKSFPETIYKNPEKYPVVPVAKADGLSLPPYPML